MENFFDTILLNIDVFILIMVRVTGIFVVAPIFSRNSIPATMRIGLAVLMAFTLLPLMANGASVDITNLIELGFFALREFLLGIIIGFIATIYFSAIYLAGTIIDTQMGFGIVNVFDPQTNTQIPVMGNFYNVILTLIFIVMDGHHLLIRALVHSYQILPIGFKFLLSDTLLEKVIVIFIEVFLIAFKFSAPVLGMIFLANVLLGILARTMPQMNVFIVGLPLKVFIGLLTVLVTLQFFIPFAERLFEKIFNTIYEIMNILSKG